MSRFVRASKFRHVYGSPARREDCYENVPVTRNAWDSNFCSVNEKFIAVCLESGGGGAFAVFKHDHTGKLIDVPRVNGHKAPVLDIEWNPFNSNMIASASEDRTIMIWLIPDSGLERNLEQPALTLHGHGKKVGQIKWHPVAENILFSNSADLTVRVWNINSGEEIKCITNHPDMIFWMSFNHDGSKLATTCKDKKLRIFDAHSTELLNEEICHEGSKSSRCVYVGKNNRIITTGFSKTHERQIILWSDDLKALKIDGIDTSSGVLMPFYDSDLGILYVAGKGDGNIRYYEIVEEAPYMHFLSQYSSSDPQRGFGILPKRAVDVNKCEINRFYKLHSKNCIEPISFIVPRKADCFQEDIYPETQGDKPSLTADEWVSGKTASPLLLSLKDGFTPSSVEYIAPVIDQEKIEKMPTTLKEYEEAYNKLKTEIKKLNEEINAKNKHIQTLEEKIKTLD